ncbi:hypothetical protein [Geotalea toluenoxydans]|uniref:hypothetical protein n=1 Tax=Geotalea toluenoxydans TaxID=421624 RepID=UPI000A3E560E|nr:hypothetical protein [Geotalea toluenoxydans]
MERVPYWNISFGLLIDILSLPALAIFGYGIYRHWLRIRQGKASVRLGLTLDALKVGPLYLRSFLTKGIVGTRIYKKLFTGMAHGFLFWGMVVLTVGTILVFANVLFGIPVFRVSSIVSLWELSWTPPGWLPWPVYCSSWYEGSSPPSDLPASRPIPPLC